MSGQESHVAWRRRGSRAWAVDSVAVFEAHHSREAEVSFHFPSRGAALGWVERIGDRWLEEQGVDVEALKRATESK